MLKIRNEVGTDREDLITRLEPNMLKSHKTILEAVAGNYFDDAPDSDPAYCFAYYDFYKMAGNFWKFFWFFYFQMYTCELRKMKINKN